MLPNFTSTMWQRAAFSQKTPNNVAMRFSIFFSFMLGNVALIAKIASHNYIEYHLICNHIFRKLTFAKAELPSTYSYCYSYPRHFHVSLRCQISLRRSLVISSSIVDKKFSIFRQHLFSIFPSLRRYH